MSTPRKGAQVGDVSMLDAARRGQGSIADIPEDDGPTVTGAEAIGKEVYTWTSQDGKCVVKFSRPPGGSSDKVALLLGPQQCGNYVMNKRYRAALSIVQMNGERVEPFHTVAGYTVLRKWFGEDDENFDRYVEAWEIAIYPETIEALLEAQGLGVLPDDIARIAKNAGLSHQKKSPPQGTSANS